MSGAGAMVGTTKAYRRGTHRSLPLEQTWECIQPLAQGAGVTRLANVTGLDTVGLPVVTACRPNSRSISIGQGKGLTLMAAKVSALMEALECHYAERPELPLVRASYAEMRARGATLELASIPRGRASWFRENLALLWVQGRDLMDDGAPIWVPFDLVHLDWTLPLSLGSELFMMNTNGLASGNCRTEAESHAICELIERDATTLLYCHDAAGWQRRRVALDSVADPDCRMVLEQFARAGLDVGVWDATTDVGIPSFLCMVVESAPSALRPLPPMGGEGCHPVREIALLRALTEAAQKRLTMITGARDDLTRAGYAKRLGDRYVREYGTLMRGTGERSFREAPSQEHGSFEEDLAWELALLRAVGIRQAASVELFQKEPGLSVVRVIIPGLEGIHDVPNFVPGQRARQKMARIA